MTNLMVGSNFDPELPYLLGSLNKRYAENDIRVSEVYGSIKELKIFGSARPDFRLPDVSLQSFAQSVTNYDLCGIAVNYTENSPIVDKGKIDKATIEKQLATLVKIGVKRITLAHPLAMELVSELSDLPIEVSTIYALQNEYQLTELKRRAKNINKVCVDVDLNRDFQALLGLNKVAKAMDVDLELLANEFCIFDCIDRVQCYNEHTQVKTDLEAGQFKRYPMGNCINLRQEPVEWARARFILPQHLSWYNDIIHINSFKITGRTHPTEYIRWVTEQYLARNYKGNLLQLWADVKNIKRVNNNQSHLVPNVEINTDIFTPSFLWQYYDDKLMKTNRAYETEYLLNLLK